MKRSEAIEIVREYYPSSGKDLNEALETLIPELKESEDEIIRKALVELVRKHCVNETRCMMEKWLEKQRSRNLANSEKTCKVEPKFHEGEWVFIEEVEGYKNGPFQIKTVGSFGYDFDEYHTIPFAYEYVLSKWTIQDAKDGDVLSFNDGHGNDSIELIKSITDNKIEFWFCLTNGDRYEVFDGIIPYTNLVSREDATPATKEQCDFLFQEMKEAGYEWDAEKNELKKIEQKHTPKHRVGDTIYYNSFGELKSMIVANVVTDSTDNLMYEDKEGNAVFEKDIIEQNPVEWSEEDKDMVDNIIKAINHLLKQNDSWGFLEDCLDWLKSLKERYTWRPSDEQIKAIRLARAFVTDDFDEHPSLSEILVELEEQLKKLKR